MDDSVTWDATDGPSRPLERDFVTTYVRRIVDDELDAVLPQLPAVMLDGPKGVGKTETALQRAQTVWRLDEPAQLAIIEADPGIVSTGPAPVLIDEWQRFPAVWDTVKRAVDAGAPAGAFLLTGSAATRGTTHSGAARIVTARMRPLTLPERGVWDPTVSLAELLAGTRPAVTGATSLTLRDYTDEIVRSGFPGLRGLSGRALRTQLDGYIDRIIDSDVPDAGREVRRPATLRAWLTAYAAAVGEAVSYEKVRDAATPGHGDKPAKTTTLPYIDVLTQLRILDPLHAWLPGLNHLSRLTQAPKHHLADPAIAVRLLGLDAKALLAGETGNVSIPRDGVLLGGLFESLATLSVRVFAQQSEAKVSHLRTYGGEHEVDLIVETGARDVLAIEVKLSATVDDPDVRHLNWLEGRIGDRLLDKVVLCTGPRAYRRPDGVAVVPLALLGA
jgi:predicted AAA+ superfamily ATPase